MKLLGLLRRARPAGADPEPDLDLRAGGALLPNQRLLEALHAQWHAANPGRACEYPDRPWARFR